MSVVTDTSPLPDEDLREGDTAAQVSGEDVIVLLGKFAAYRDMPLGLRGPDVDELQGALVRLGRLKRAERSGTVDLPTLAAFQRLQALRPTPQDAVPAAVLRTQFVFVPTLPVRLTGQLRQVGDTPIAGALQLQSVAKELTCDVSLEGIDSSASIQVVLPDGTTRPGTSRGTAPVDATADGTKSSATGNGDDSAGGDAAANTDKGSLRVAADLSPEDLLAAGSAGPVSVRVVTSRSSPDSMIVPVSALWSRAGNRTVAVVLDESGARRDVQVEPELESDGLVAITAADSALRPGQHVLVGSPRRGDTAR